MTRTNRTLVLFLLVLLPSSALATLTLSKRNKFDLNWWFQNTSTKYTIMEDHGYYRDYNGDGLPDYLILLEDSPNADWRLFTLDTRPTGTARTFPGSRTAGRDFFHQPGRFIPRSLWTPFSPSMDSPDLVLVGTNQTTNTYDAPYTQFIFQRLNKRLPSWPIERTWAIDVVSTFTPQVYWPDVSYNNDDYPDFFVYHSAPGPNRTFVVSCHNGLDGSLIWTRTFLLDPQDPGTGISFGAGLRDGAGFSLGMPRLSLQVLPHLPQHGLRGDFDRDGKPEILLSYSFGTGNYYTSYSMTADLNLLNAQGNFLAPYTSAWTRLLVLPSALSPPASVAASDYNGDGYADLLLQIMSSWAFPSPPPFAGYDLKNRQWLFQANPAEFGKQPQDANGYLVFDQYAYQSWRRCDVNGDGWSDLDVYRAVGQEPALPLRIGLFNAYAGGGPQRARMIWLQQLTGFDRAFGMVNDFNGDDLLDYVLLRTPDVPGSPTAGLITFHLAHATVGATGLTLARQFDYAPAYSFPWNPTSDTLVVEPTFFSRVGDVDGDGQRDTVGCLSAAFDAGRDYVIDLAYGYVFVYDNTPGTGPPPLTAELQLEVRGENWVPYPTLHYAYCLGASSFVDNNRDGFVNDVIVNAGEQAIYSLAFQYRALGQGPPRVIEAAYSDLDGNGVDAGDQVVLTLDRSVELATTAALRASHFSLPVQGDSLGRTGFGVGLNRYDSRQLVLTLGSSAKLTVPGVFSTARRTPNSPSGIDFATSLPIGSVRSLDGLTAVAGPGVDVRYNLVRRSLAIGPRGGTLAVQNVPDAAYTEHSLTLPGGAAPSTVTFTVQTAVRDLGAPGAFQIVGSLQTFSRAARITAEYHDGDVDWELGYLESEMHVQQLVEKPKGVFQWLPVPGTHSLSGFLAGNGRGGTRKLDAENEKVSVDTRSLNPNGSVGQPGIFAGLPIETVDERKIDIKPGAGSAIIRDVPALLTPNSLGAYPGHAIEFPGWVTTTATDPDPRRITVKIRTATMAERYAPSGGQAFPSQSGAVFVVETADKLGQPLAFTTPVNLTVQYKERSDPALTDVVRFGGTIGVPALMRLVKNASPDAINFAWVTGPPQTVNTAQSKVIIPNLTGLTGFSGKGTYGVVAAPGATPVEHWEIYR